MSDIRVIAIAEIRTLLDSASVQRGRLGEVRARLASMPANSETTWTLSVVENRMVAIAGRMQKYSQLIAEHEIGKRNITDALYIGGIRV